MADPEAGDEVAGATPAEQARPISPSIRSHYEVLHQKCGEILTASLDGARERQHAQSYSLVGEIDTWRELLANRPEIYLIEATGRELQYALLALVQGHYCYAFQSLRLVLELSLQAVFLSAHAVELREWLDNRKDTVWGEIMNDQNGVFSVRFARAFAPELEPHVKHHAGMAAKIYRECSECVHGNVQKHVVLPVALAFDANAFSLWHEKAKVVATVILFSLCLRYMHELDKDARSKIEPILIDRLGHIREIREGLGYVGDRQ